MTPYSAINDYSRYFSKKQKVYLVNMSAERDRALYESLSGVVISSGKDSLELMIMHGGEAARGSETCVATYKLTSESLGGGIQVLADLTGVVDGTIFQFRMHGTLEMFQRRVVSRAELSLPICHVRKKLALTSYKKEWQRVHDHLRSAGAVPGLVLRETAINLSAGGIGLTIGADGPPPPLSMFFIALNSGLPVCALAETMWNQRIGGGARYGFRFIHILKEDQVRINNHIVDTIRKGGGSYVDYKRNWVLIDKMVADIEKS